MPLFDYRCECGHRFEQLVDNWRAPNPGCPHCAGHTRRAPGRICVLGVAAAPPGDSDTPKSWDGVQQGDREFVARWRQRLDQRRAFEEKFPEHSTRREAIAAHEGVFENNPLTYRELASRAADSGDATTAAGAASQARSIPAPSP